MAVSKFMAKEVSKVARRWTIKEIEFFAEILADPENSSAQSLERLALKKSSNNKVFKHTQCEFVKGLKCDSFRDINELIFSF